MSVLTITINNCNPSVLLKNSAAESDATHLIISSDLFTKGLSTHIHNLAHFRLAINLTLIIQSCQHFAQFRAAQSSWHVLNCNLIRSSVFKLQLYIVFRNLHYELINHLCNRLLLYTLSHNIFSLVTYTDVQRVRVVSWLMTSRHLL